MSTMTGTLRRMILFGVAGMMITVGMGAVARADVASDAPGAILIFPKIVVDTSGILGPATDTQVQITNTSNRPISARCFVVDATSHCSNAPTTPCTVEAVAAGAAAGAGGCPLGGVCQASWRENDFQMTLTKRQPIAFRASQGLPTFPCDGLTAFCANGQTNNGSSIPPVQEDPFVGEIKCVETNANFVPDPGIDPLNNFTGDLKGEAVIISATPETAPTNTSTVDARAYNGVGIQSKPFNNGDEVLQLGGDPSVAEYNGCPNILILDHFFDGAKVVTHGGNSSATVTTDLTLVPCGEDFATQTMKTITVQFLVFNEFEQRFSTSTPITCFREVQLSNLDTRPSSLDDSASIFSFSVQGTLSGQTRIRSVASPNASNTIIGVAEEFWKCGASAANGFAAVGSDGPCAGPNETSSTAANLHFAGTRTGPGDQILLSPQATEP